MIVTIIVFLLILSILVLIHEAGHFFVAKKLGIKVEEFGFGFPPRIWSKKRGETIYSINLLPIGGFVKLYGEDEAGSGSLKVKDQKVKIKDQDRAFFARPIWQRALVVVAGVIMNFILAVVIISYIFTAQGVPTVTDNVLVSTVVKGSPADQAGLKKEDIIYSVNGDRVTTPSQIIDDTKKHLGEKLNLVVLSGKNKKEISVIPRIKYPSDQGPMGVAISSQVVVTKYPWYKAPFLGTREVAKDSLLILTGLVSVVRDLVVHATIPAGVAGPVGIAEATGQFVQLGPNAVLSFMALLSLNLAVLNILPIPALDGGRLFFIIIEAVTRRKVHPKFEAYAHAVGIALLLILIAVITAHDFIRLFHGQPILPTQ